MCDGYIFKAALDLDLFTVIVTKGGKSQSLSAKEIAKYCGIKIDRPEEFLNSLVCSGLLERN